MKWKSHTAIARAIAVAADIHGEARQALYLGVIDPDRSPDYQRKVSKNGKNSFSRAAHHHPSTSMVMSYVWEARLAYLAEDECTALRSIGRALHYVQDKAVSKGFRGWTHDWRENAISKLEPPVDEVERGFAETESSPEFVRECINLVHNKKNPQKALRLATYYSAAIFAAVFSPVENGDEKRKKCLRQYQRRRRRLVFSLLLLLVAAGSFVLSVYPLTAGSAGLALLLLLSNHDYRAIKKRASWYGNS